jgi:hypothetical protein
MGFFRALATYVSSVREKRGANAETERALSETPRDYQRINQAIAAQFRADTNNFKAELNLFDAIANLWPWSSQSGSDRK